MPTTLERLVVEQERFEGVAVRVEGVVRRYDDPLHYWLEDEVPHRVAVVPPDLFEALVGERVSVGGAFRFVEGEGRVIDVEEVSVVGDRPVSASH